MSNRPIPDPVKATFHESDLFDRVGEPDDGAADRAGDAEAPVADDRRRGRARQWLAESGLRPSVPVEPASPGRPDRHAPR